MTEKPPILGLVELAKLTDHHLAIALDGAEAQRDADVEWYKKLEMQYLDDCREVNEMQARQDTAREIFEEIEKELTVKTRDDGVLVERFYIISQFRWQDLKEKHEHL